MELRGDEPNDMYGLADGYIASNREMALRGIKELYDDDPIWMVCWHNSLGHV
jgi:hypothetical protein